MIRAILLATIAMSSIGCSIDLSITDLGPAPLVLAKTTGLVPGSSQRGTTIGGSNTYMVQSTLGNYHSQMDQTTTDNSYRIYSSVQGSLISN